MIEICALINHLEKRQQRCSLVVVGPPGRPGPPDSRASITFRASFVLWNVLSGRSGAERAKDRGGGEVIPFILATAPTTHTNLIAFHSALLQTPTQKYLLP